MHWYSFPSYHLFRYYSKVMICSKFGFCMSYNEITFCLFLHLSNLCLFVVIRNLYYVKFLLSRSLTLLTKVIGDFCEFDFSLIMGNSNGSGAPKCVSNEFFTNLFTFFIIVVILFSFLVHMFSHRLKLGLRNLSSINDFPNML